MTNKKYWAGLSAAGADSRDLFKICRAWGDPEGFFKNGSSFESGLKKAGLREIKATRIASKLHQINPDIEYEKLAKAGVQLVAWPEADFPVLLKEIPDAPAVLYIIGRATSLKGPFLAIVGTRRSTVYGEKVTRLLASGAAQAGLGIVSGMAHGIDSVAHQSSLEEKGITVGVAAWGFNHIPFLKKKLVREIIQASGAIISEYHPEITAQEFTFVQRNRLISGLAKATLVTEAPIGSGALITADFALEQNREVLAVPGPIDLPGSGGGNQLIKQGAVPVTEINDILKILNLPLCDLKKKKIAALSPIEEKIISLIANEPLNLDSMTAQSGLKTAEILATISLLEIKDLITKDASGKYRQT